MARHDEGGGHPIFWLLFGFFCGVVATLGALLLISSEVTGTSGPPAEAIAVDEPPALDGAAPAAGTSQLPAPAPEASPAAPTPSAAPPAAPGSAVSPSATNRPAPAPNSDAQIAEDAAASGMTARRR